MTRTLQALNMTFALIFIVEFCMKVFAHGLHKYFQEMWNILDFAAVIASVMDMLNVTGGPELKLVVEALLLSVPSVVNVAVVCAIFTL
eukprot:8547756-Prorocentrum_lima.AAC.1